MCAVSRGRPLHICRGSSEPCHVCRPADAGAPWKGLSGGANGGAEYLDQAQYNTARIVRHLALDKDAVHRKAAHAAVPALVALMKVACPLNPAFGCIHQTLSPTPHVTFPAAVVYLNALAGATCALMLVQTTDLRALRTPPRSLQVPKR